MFKTDIRYNKSISCQKVPHTGSKLGNVKTVIVYLGECNFDNSEQKKINVHFCDGAEYFEYIENYSNHFYMFLV